MIVELKVIWNEKIDSENIDFLNSSDFLNSNYYVNIKLQGNRKANQLDEIDSGQLWSII